MARKKNVDNSKNEEIKNENETAVTFDEELIEKRKNEILGILIITLGILSFISLFTTTGGLVGQQLAKAYFQIIGTGSYLLPLLLVIWGGTLIRYKGLKLNYRLTGFILSYISVMSIIHVYLYSDFPLENAYLGEGGGFLAGGLAWLFIKLFGHIGAYVTLGSLLLIGILLWFDILLFSIIHKIGSEIAKLFKRVFNNKKKNTDIDGEDLDHDYDREKEDIRREEYDQNDIEKDFLDFSSEVDNNEQDIVELDESELEKTREKESVKTKKDKVSNKKSEKTNDNEIKNYSLPPLGMLKSSNLKRSKPGNKSELLEETLQSFGVKARIIKVSHGPTITRYELQPASGVKVSKIVNLADDIALVLAAPGVRIEAPIPGKAAVGVEVPHQKNIVVRLRDILSSVEFSKTKSKLPLALGMGIDGQPVITDLAQMPHLLVAGATGSGKSVCINTIITSILYKSTPEEVKMILVDPKKVELSNYRGLPHLFAPVVTDPKKAANVLKLVVNEMENRYELFSASGTRGITSYNKKVELEDRIPYIVVIIDELSDLMMVSASDVEDNICRLAQMARAAGIHLVVATQRPSVDVITGLIKANIPSRISFAVSSQTDSRTILDMGGAEKLLGKGDMLLADAGTQKPQRVQGAFIDNDEINKLADYVKNQGNPDYEVDLEDIKEVSIEVDDESDDLYHEAVKLVVNYRASISMLQRRLHVGHSRAARLIDMMEEDGIVGPYAGSKAREVLISPEELDEFFNGQDENVKEENPA